MDKLIIPNGEKVILSNIGVSNSNSIIKDNYSELYLTTKNIIWVKKNIWGRTKKIHYFPIFELNRVNDYPHIYVEKNKMCTSKLVILHLKGKESFYFGGSNKVKIKTWIKELNKLFGYDGYLTHNKINNFTLYETIEYFFINLFIKKSNDIFNNEENMNCHMVEKKCISCASILVGGKGHKIRCKYCDTEQII